MAFIKSLVSRDRNRFQEDGYNLDLTYITDRILAMGIPATGVSTVWRNSLNDVCEFLEARHKGHFMIWNLTENTYDYDKFNNQILDFAFSDHHAPPLSMLFTIVKSIDGWLQVDPENVAVVHCKGGKGRTGLVICCWLIYSAICLHPDEALTMFAEKRSSTGRGVKQPSQKRYIEYFYSLLITDIPVMTRVMGVKRVMIGPFSEGTELSLDIITYEGTNKENLVFSGVSKCDETSPSGESFGALPEKSAAGGDKRMIVFNVNSNVARDVLISVKRKKKNFFHLNFNTMFSQATKHTRQILPSEFDKYDAKAHDSNIVLLIEFDLVGEVVDDEMDSMISIIKRDYVARKEKEQARRLEVAAAAAAAASEQEALEVKEFVVIKDPKKEKPTDSSETKWVPSKPRTQKPRLHPMFSDPAGSPSPTAFSLMGSSNKHNICLGHTPSLDKSEEGTDDESLEILE